MVISETQIEVRYAETDQMGIVYHANYLVWMEIGRTKLIQELGFKYADLEKDGILAPVIDVQATYIHPIKYGDIVTVKTWIEEYNGLRTTYGYEILSSNGDLAVTGSTKHVCVRKENFKPISLRKLYPDWHRVYENAKRQEEIEEK
ncbi:acyl-CoA thioesterase [Lederbergia panacisoli]|uniref:acyl-CoA thioesterase n=1 Tax=Lederbergia panacisoli TaxID=1255251 RepID=UPI00214BDAEB|nr:thioesterase family protein [Lederbergia panacisoli]MCR2822892.1 acyl-CoA thioesterase [Lederbergia panacisoli]